MTTTATPEKVLRVREVAHHLDCDEDTVYAILRRGEMRAIHLGRVLRVPESALRDFIAGR